MKSILGTYLDFEIAPAERRAIKLNPLSCFGLAFPIILRLTVPTEFGNFSVKEVVWQFWNFVTIEPFNIFGFSL